MIIGQISPNIKNILLFLDTALSSKIANLTTNHCSGFITMISKPHVQGGLNMTGTNCD